MSSFVGEDTYDLGGGGPYSMSPAQIPPSPQPTLGIRPETLLVSHVGGPRGLYDSDSLGWITGAPACGHPTCGAREKHHRIAILLCCLAFVALVAVHYKKK